MTSKNIDENFLSSALIQVLQQRFVSNKHRHPQMDWAFVLERLFLFPEKWDALNQMEESGGMPDVLGGVQDSGSIVFYDCSPESPLGRRSLCYDQEALEERKEHKPKNSACALAQSMGVQLLGEEEYLRLQSYGDFDTKTSSWLATKPDIRSLGGAIFGDKRYGRTFIYHNGAASYYAARGFRALLVF